MMFRRACCLFLPLALLGSVACGRITVRPARSTLPSTKLADPVPIEAEGRTWTHEASGIVFDEGGPTWQRSDIQRYDEEGNDIGVGYDRLTPQGPAVLTIYVFPPPTIDGRVASFEEHMREERRTLEQAIGQIEPVSTVKDDEGRVFALEYEQAPPMAGAPTIRSILALRSRGAWRIKYRLTVPARSRNDTAEALVALAARLDLPPPGLAAD